MKISNFSAKFVLAAAAFLFLFVGCGGQPQALTDASRLALRAANQALADNAVTNAAIVKAFRDLIQADFDREKEKALREIIVVKEGKNYIGAEDLVKYRAWEIAGQNAVDNRIKEIEEWLARNQINGELAAGILKKLVEVEDFRAKRPTMAQDGKIIFDNLLDLYDQIKGVKPKVEGR